MTTTITEISPAKVPPIMTAKFLSVPFPMIVEELVGRDTSTVSVVMRLVVGFAKSTVVLTGIADVVDNIVDPVIEHSVLGYYAV